jgi:opacity protein-like surface antigen
MHASLEKQILALALLMLPFLSFAQTSSKWEFGLTAGAFVYQGDLTPSPVGSYRTPGISLGVFGSYLLTRSISLRTNIFAGRLNGNDAAYNHPEWRQQRNFNFSAPLVQVSELVVWNYRGSRANVEGNRLSPYVFAGVGLAWVSISRDWSKFNREYFSTESTVLNGLAEDTAHSLPGIIPALPVGIGIQYALSPGISLMAESSFHYGFTDYLDGFSKSANSVRNDNFINHSVGIIYRPAKRSGLDCPVIRY